MTRHPPQHMDCASESVYSRWAPPALSAGRVTGIWINQLIVARPAAEPYGTVNRPECQPDPRLLRKAVRPELHSVPSTRFTTVTFNSRSSGKTYIVKAYSYRDY